MTDDPEAIEALFTVEAAAVGYKPGRAEANLQTAIAAASRAELLQPEDAGMIGAALVAARKLDRAEADTSTKGGYLVAQLLTPYREVLQALRLPTALSPAAAPAPATGPATSAEDWLRDAFGTAE